MSWLILVLADSYRSGSCTEHQVTADRDGAEWTVRLEARTDGEWCTLEGCGWEGSTLADLIGPDGSVPGAGCPPVHALELDEPVPAGVTVVAAPAAG